MGEKGKKKSRILLIVCGLLLLAGAIIGIVMFRMQAGASAYNESIKTAEKYADSGEYELAVLTYENAIKDRPKEEHLKIPFCLSLPFTLLSIIISAFIV